MTLTTQQKDSLKQGEPISIQVDGQQCVLVDRATYEKTQEVDYGEWTAEEIDLLACEAADLVAGDDLNIE